MSKDTVLATSMRVSESMPQSVSGAARSGQIAASLSPSGKEAEDIACIALAIAAGLSVTLSSSAASPLLPAMTITNSEDRVVTLFGSDNIARYFLRRIGSECEGLEALVSDSSADIPTSIPTEVRRLLMIQRNSCCDDECVSAAKALYSAAQPSPVEIDIAADGLVGSLFALFSSAIRSAFAGQLPQLSPSAGDAIIARCGNPKFGDFQCNNAMSLAKELKGITTSEVLPRSPKEVAEKIVAHLSSNSLVSSTSIAPNGFINIVLTESTLIHTIAAIVKAGVKPPRMEHRRVLVDFSSPNIAKEMHVGHLRSTIIGDSLCRLLEFCGFDVLRVNHVGDWGTQFGMLISYIEDAYPDIANNPPNISDLTILYKAAKKRFDEDEEFKERSRRNVVKLQSGDENCRKIWLQLCDISRQEFQKVYDALQIRLTEVGESFYNPLIPSTIEELQQAGVVQVEDKLLIIKLDHFDFPLILRKSDGGYGYDSTDMAALKYRLQTLKRDWLIYITDSGQSSHFYKCFDVARAAGWADKGQKLDFIGFGVVCGNDGKKFKTRSGDTVRLIDLLNEARDRMYESLKSRAEEKKTSLSEEELLSSASAIGYGAVKYFDLKQNPVSSYVFSYDRMLDTKGDTAVYLLFAYARVASILRKAKEEKGADLAAMSVEQLTELLVLGHPAERVLAFEILQFAEVVKSAVLETMPNRICDYVKELSVKFTDFVTKCQVLNSEEFLSRLMLCEATRRVMLKCFELLGINALDRI